MILNRIQLKKAQVWLESLETTVNKHPATYYNTPVEKAKYEAIVSIRNELKQEIADYETTKTRPLPSFIKLTELPVFLIKARINKGLTQKELATKLGITTEQLQRYENRAYKDCSFKLIVKIAKALELHLTTMMC